MNPVNLNDGENLCRGILEEAHTEAERLLLQARQEAEALLITTTTTEEKAGQERLKLTQQECTRRKERMLASLPVEMARLRDTRIETLLQSIHDEIRHRLQIREGFDYQGTLIALATYAINRMAGTKFVVTLSSDDVVALGVSLNDSIHQHIDKDGLEIQVVSGPTMSEGGLTVRDNTGRQEWDNRLTARLERLWPDLRIQLAAMLPLVLSEPDKGGGHDALKA